MAADADRDNRWPVALVAVLLVYALGCRPAGHVAAGEGRRARLVRAAHPRRLDGLDLSDRAVLPGHLRAAGAAWRVWEYASPGGSPRVGILRFETTRGDRLFISLLGSAFIHLAWLGLVGSNLWWALALSLVYAVGVFRYV